MVNNAFANVLRRLRVEKNLSQEELGSRAGLHRTYISQLERGLKTPTLKSFFLIAAALEIDPAVFIKKITDEIQAN